MSQKLFTFLALCLLSAFCFAPSGEHPAAAQVPVKAGPSAPLPFTPHPVAAPTPARPQPAQVVSPSLTSAQIGALNAQLAVAGAQNTVLGVQLSALNSQNAVLTSQNAALTLQAAALNGQVSTLSQQVASLTAAANAPPAALGTPYKNTTGRLVFAHFQSSCVATGSVPMTTYAGFSLTPAGAALAIKEAKAIGYDGFSFDLNDVTPDYLSRFTVLLAGANTENTLSGWTGTQTGTVNSRGVGKFSLYLTFDCSNSGLEAGGVISSMFLRFCNDPAYYHVTDSAGVSRPFLSTYTGAGGSWALVKQIYGGELTTIRAAGVNPFFVPGFDQYNSDGSALTVSQPAWVSGLLVGLADGGWQYPSTTSPLGPKSAIPQQEAEMAALQAAGLYSQGALMNGQWGAAKGPINGGTRFYFEYYGGESDAAYWRSICLVSKPRSVQDATFNDADEASNRSSLYGSGDGSVWAGFAHYLTPGYYKSHLGHVADDSDWAYGLMWYKTGQQPILTRDALTAYYRTQPALIVPTGDRFGPIAYSTTESGDVGGASGIPDIMCVTVNATQSETVTLTVTPPAPPATHTHLVADSDDNRYVYDPITPFTGNELGETLQVTAGSGWAISNHTVQQCREYYTQDGWQMMLYLSDTPPADARVTGGQGSLFASGATLPALPPLPLISSRVVPPGITHLRLPFMAGQPSLTATRNGQTVVSVPGLAPIVGTGTDINFNIFSASAHN